MAQGDVTEGVSYGDSSKLESSTGLKLDAVVVINSSGQEPGTATSPTSVTINGAQSSVFGELLASQPTPVIQLYLADLNDIRRWTVAKAGGATATDADGQGVLTLSTAANDSVKIESVRHVPYEPGMGVSVRFTAAFTTGVTSSTQLAGALHTEDGLAIGYDGTAFGVLHRYGGVRTVYRLDITGAASGSENATVTLNGTGVTVALTNTTAQGNAREVAGTTFAGWMAYQLDDAVYFVADAAEARAGTYTFSSGTATGTMTAVRVGLAPTETWVAQASFSLDVLDGTGNSGMTLDPTKGNVYEVRYGWLGYLGATWCVINPADHRMVAFHRVDWSNANIKPWAQDPRFHIIYHALSTGSTTALVIKGGSCAALMQGSTFETGPPLSSEATKTVGTTEVPILALQCAELHVGRGVINRRRLILTEFGAESASKNVKIRVYIGTPENLTGYNFQQDDAAHAYWTDTASTAITGTMEQIRAVSVESGGSRGLTGRVLLTSGQVLIITGETSASTSAVTVEINGREDV